MDQVPTPIRSTAAPVARSTDAEADGVLARLRQLDHAQIQPPYLHYRSRKEYLLSAVRFEGSVLALPLEGCKRWRSSAANGAPRTWQDVQPGSALLVTQRCTLDVINQPHAATGRYRAVCIPFGDNVISAARQLLGTPLPNRSSPPAQVPLQTLQADLNQWLDALTHHAYPEAGLALTSLVLRLHTQGHTGLLSNAASSLTDKVRGLFNSDIRRTWSSAHVEQALAISGASLRRHLAAEGTSLREILTEARLSQALVLLSVDGLPVKTVAMRVGYTSVSAFSRRFRARYGTDPSELN